ncbi:MAG: hypothetical protein DCC47_16025 [Acidobacteria bacterium]|nr:MAG: hypothetical protein DCC47_16025 [Acidobacteriota bacterium]
MTDYVIPRPPGWPKLASAAMHGVLGEIVTVLEPDTEADPPAILANLLAMAGNAIGAGPHARIGGDLHPARLHVAIVGDTARARKGTAHGMARWVMRHADEGWLPRILGGFGSGEAVVDAVRDPDPDDDNDRGAGDHRLLVREAEFARVLKVASRDGSTLSPLLRHAWDDGRLEVRTRKSTTVATSAHVSVVADITLDELHDLLGGVEIANGFGNRFLWVLARRTRKLPSGGSLTDDDVRRLAEPLRDAIAAARKLGTITRTPAAEERWRGIYDAIDDEAAGAYGKIVARVEAHLLRLAVLYAALDGSGRIDVCHLDAALAVWDYCRASALRIFGTTTGDPVADRIYAALLAAPDGLDRTAQNNLFDGHRSSAALDRARSRLVDRGLAVEVPQGTEGRTRRLLFLAEEAEKAEEGLAERVGGRVSPLNPHVPQGRGEGL